MLNNYTCSCQCIILLKYSSNYSIATGSLRFYSKNESSALNANIAYNNDNNNNGNGNNFETVWTCFETVSIKLNQLQMVWMNF